MRTYSEIKNEINGLYHAGYICMCLTGCDTQYAAVRHALEHVVGEQDCLVWRTGPLAIGYELETKTVRYSEEELRTLLRNCKEYIDNSKNAVSASDDIAMAAAALEWVIGERDSYSL